jgi:hypothetical protein
MRMVSTILMASILISTLASAETVLPLGKPMPPLKGEFLTGRQALLPDAASGRVASACTGLHLQFQIRR